MTKRFIDPNLYSKALTQEQKIQRADKEVKELWLRGDTPFIKRAVCVREDFILSFFSPEDLASMGYTPERLALDRAALLETQEPTKRDYLNLGK